MNTFFHTFAWVIHCSVWKDLTEREFLNIEKSIKKWRENETLIMRAMPRITKMWPRIWKIFTFNQNELLKKLMFSPFGWNVHCWAGLTSVWSWSANFSQKKNIVHNVDKVLSFSWRNSAFLELTYSSIAATPFFNDLFMVSCKDRETEDSIRCLWFIVGASQLVLILKWEERKK